MIELLGGSLPGARAVLVALLVGARVAPLTVLVPWIALRATPPLLRIAVLVALTAALTPLAMSAAPELPGGALPFAMLALREAAIGAVFAIVGAVPLIALDHAGRWIDAMRGGPFAESASPAGETTSPLGSLHLMLGTVIFLGLGGHRLVIAALGEGLVAVPPGAAIESTELATFLLGAARIVAHALTLAVSFAAPAAVAMIAIEITLGILGRAAPALPMMHFAGMPVRAAAALGAVLLGLSVLVPHLPDAMRRGVSAADALVRELAP